MFRERKLVIGLILAVALVTVLNLPDTVRTRMEYSLREGLAPLQSLIANTAQTVSQVVLLIRGIGGMASENRAMAAELVRLRSEVRYLRALEGENIELRRQLEHRSRLERELISCEVIARDMSGWWQTVRLGKGRMNGVNPDMAVVTPSGLVGRTISASDHTSDVLLISDPSSRISAYIQGRDERPVFGIVVGQGVNWRGEVMLRMEFINKNYPVNPGDEVLTSGLGGVFPKGIIIGYVEKAHRDRSDLYQYADIVPTADLGTLSYVFALVEGDDPEDALLREHRRIRNSVEIR